MRGCHDARPRSGCAALRRNATGAHSHAFEAVAIDARESQACEGALARALVGQALRGAAVIEERFVEGRPDGPFVDRPGGDAISQKDRYLLEMLAQSTLEALGQARAASALFEACRPIAQGANSAALAVAALERLYEELQAIEVAYGLELTNEAKRQIEL